MNVMSDGSKIPATRLLGDRSMMGVPCIGATEYSSGVVGSSRSRYPFVRVKQKPGPSSVIRFEKTRIKLVRGQICLHSELAADLLLVALVARREPCGSLAYGVGMLWHRLRKPTPGPRHLFFVQVCSDARCTLEFRQRAAL
jgi:hypothetical protein